MKLEKLNQKKTAQAGTGREESEDFLRILGFSRSLSSVSRARERGEGRRIKASFSLIPLSIDQPSILVLAERLSNRFQVLGEESSVDCWGILDCILFPFLLCSTGSLYTTAVVTLQKIVRYTGWFIQSREQKRLGLMGSILCCLQADDFNEQEHPAPHYCRCLFYFLRCFPVCEALFLRRGRVGHSDEQGTGPLRVDEDNSSFDTFQSPPRPLSFDDPRCSQPLHGKTSRHWCEESESLCKGLSQTENTEKKEKKESKYELCKKDSKLEMTSEIAYIYSTSEDEDTCPICLEEYVPENPSITLQCAHHFHLSCIYEWMERSETCPVCGKVMLFDEER